MNLRKQESNVSLYKQDDELKTAKVSLKSYIHIFLAVRIGAEIAQLTTHPLQP